MIIDIECLKTLYLIWSVWTSDIWYGVFERMLFDMKCLNMCYLIWSFYASAIWHEELKQVLWDMKCLITWCLIWSVWICNRRYGVFKQVIFDMKCSNKGYYKCLYQVQVIAVFPVLRLLTNFVCWFMSFNFPFGRFLGAR